MVRREIKWSSNAHNDRYLIIEFWYKNNGNNKYSKQLDIEIRNIINYLKRHERMGKRSYKKNVRYLIKNHLIIFYKIHKDYIEILRIKDSRQDLRHLPL